MIGIDWSGLSICHGEKLFSSNKIEEFADDE
jgi:hypothetical protein